MVVEELIPKVFRVEVPLPQNPLKAVNSYIVKGKARNLIIDTGFNCPECSLVMTKALRTLGVCLSQSDFFITHFHTDHLGLVSELAHEDSLVYFNRPEADILSAFSDLQELKIWLAELAGKAGFPEASIKRAVELHPGVRFAPLQNPDFTFLSDGDEITVGEYRFQCVFTPGHSPGHFCLYEPTQKILFSGDHILGDITPNITSAMDEDPLADYLASLSRIQELEVRIVFPGHRGTISDCRGRIEEIKAHHRERLDEISRILNQRSLSSYEVASYMKWDIIAPDWNSFPLTAKWFAVGEAASHLAYLEHRDQVVRSEEEGRLFFSLT